MRRIDPIDDADPAHAKASEPIESIPNRISGLGVADEFIETGAGLAFDLGEETETGNLLRIPL